MQKRILPLVTNEGTQLEDINIYLEGKYKVEVIQLGRQFIKVPARGKASDSVIFVNSWQNETHTYIKVRKHVELLVDRIHVYLSGVSGPLEVDLLKVQSRAYVLGKFAQFNRQTLLLLHASNNAEWHKIGINGETPNSLILGPISTHVLKDSATATISDHMGKVTQTIKNGRLFTVDTVEHNELTSSVEAVDRNNVVDSFWIYLGYEPVETVPLSLISSVALIEQLQAKYLGGRRVPLTVIGRGLFGIMAYESNVELILDNESQTQWEQERDIRKVRRGLFSWLWYADRLIIPNREASGGGLQEFDMTRQIWGSENEYAPGMALTLVLSEVELQLDTIRSGIPINAETRDGVYYQLLFNVVKPDDSHIWIDKLDPLRPMDEQLIVDIVFGKTTNMTESVNNLPAIVRFNLQNP